MVAMGIPPSKVGTLAERDALDLGVDDDQFIFLRFEVLLSVLHVEFYRWDGTEWLGPFDPKGEPGSGSPGAPGSSDVVGTSTSSVAIGTGTKTFAIVEADRGWGLGGRLRISSDANGANFMEGVVTAYAADTLEVSVDLVGGSGTLDDWTINLAGEPGSGAVASVNGQAGVVVLEADDIDTTSGGTFEGADVETVLDDHDGRIVDLEAGSVMAADTDASGFDFVVDEDDMASDSATKIPTQQSVKAYVDARLGSDGTKLSFITSGSVRGQFLSGGEFIIGGDYSAFQTEHVNVGVTPSVQILSTGSSASFMMGRFSNNAFQSRIFFVKSRGATVGAHGACSAADEAGDFSYAWSNGTAMAHGATIVARALATPGSDYTEAEIAIQTSNGSSVPADRLRIRSGGSVHFPSVGTTGTGANAYLDNGASPANSLLRSTSSLAYKTNVEPIEDERADALLSIDPIWYHSLAPADKMADGRAKSFYSFGAEHLAEIDPRLVSWGYRDDDFDVVETVDEDEGQVRVERVLKEGAELKPDGINDRAVMALLFNIVKRQDARIKELEEKLTLS